MGISVTAFLLLYLAGLLYVTRECFPAALMGARYIPFHNGFQTGYRNMVDIVVVKNPGWAVDEGPRPKYGVYFVTDSNWQRIEWPKWKFWRK